MKKQLFLPFLTLACFVTLSNSWGAMYNCIRKDMGFNLLDNKTGNNFLYVQLDDVASKTGFYCGRKGNDGCQGGDKVLVYGSHYMNGQHNGNDVTLYECVNGNYWQKVTVDQCRDRSLSNLKPFALGPGAKNYLVSSSAKVMLLGDTNKFSENPGEVCYSQYACSGSMQEGDIEPVESCGHIQNATACVKRCNSNGTMTLYATACLYGAPLGSYITAKNGAKLYNGCPVKPEQDPQDITITIDNDNSSQSTATGGTSHSLSTSTGGRSSAVAEGGSGTGGGATVSGVQGGDGGSAVAQGGSGTGGGATVSDVSAAADSNSDAAVTISGETSTPASGGSESGGGSSAGDGSGAGRGSGSGSGSGSGAVGKCHPSVCVSEVCKACCAKPKSETVWEPSRKVCQCTNGGNFEKVDNNWTCVIAQQQTVESFQCDTNTLIQLGQWSAECKNNGEIVEQISLIQTYCAGKNLQKSVFDGFYNSLLALNPMGCRSMPAQKSPAQIDCESTSGAYWSGTQCLCHAAGYIFKDKQCVESNDTKIKNFKSKFSTLEKIESGFGDKKSVWKNKDGKFNTARLASDSIAGVVLGTAGGLITSHVVKKNQEKSGFEDIKCTVGGQEIGDFGDQMNVGIN